MNVASRPLPTQAREYHFPEFSRHTLENGLRVIVAPIRKLPVVTALAVIDAGAVRDKTGIEGLAQLTAELLREGTAKHNGIEILEGFEKLGSSIEAGADWDSTVVSMTLLRDHLSTGLPLFAEVLRSPTFPLHEVERLKAERLAERLQILSEPRGLADEAFSRFLYASGSRYAEPIGGTSKSISTISRENVTDFFGLFYVPTSATVIIVGDVGTSEALDLVREAFGQWRGAVAPAVDSTVAENRTVRALEIVDKSDAAQAELRLGHVGIPRSHPDYFKVVIMNALLGGLFSSRINLNLRERHGYTYGASSYFDWRNTPGPFLISTAVQSEVSAEAIRETLVEIDVMRNKEVPADELALATDYLEGVFPIRYETTSAIASALANIVIFNLREDFYDTYRDNIHAVTATDVLVAARTHVLPEKLVGVVVGDPAIVTKPLESLGLGTVSHRVPADA